MIDVLNYSLVLTSAVPQPSTLCLCTVPSASRAKARFKRKRRRKNFTRLSFNNKFIPKYPEQISMSNNTFQSVEISGSRGKSYMYGRLKSACMRHGKFVYGLARKTCQSNKSMRWSEKYFRATQKKLFLFIHFSGIKCCSRRRYAFSETSRAWLLKVIY